jgi:hypothetical protein
MRSPSLARNHLARTYGKYANNPLTATTAKLNSVDSQAGLIDFLGRIAEHNFVVL